MPEQTVDEYRKAQAAEWGTYVATQAIDINGARAFNVGDPVPASHVTNGVVREDYVAKTTTKAAKSAAEER
jgi:hypothetical protein